MHPVTYEVEYAAERNRLTTFFRGILGIPWLIMALIYGIGSLFVTIVAWFALIFTGRYPAGLRRYNTGFLRYVVRFYSWYGLQTDQWPPFGFGEDPSYPVRINVVAPERQSRLKVLFRGILGIPALFMGFVMYLVGAGAATVSWFAIVFRGYQPRGAHAAFSYAFTFAIRVFAYYGVPISLYGIIPLGVGGLLVDDYPPLGDDAPSLAARSAATTAPPPAPEPPQAPAGAGAA